MPEWYGQYRRLTAPKHFVGTKKFETHLKTTYLCRQATCSENNIYINPNKKIGMFMKTTFLTLLLLLGTLLITSSCSVEPRGNENTETKTDAQAEAPPAPKTFDGNFLYSGKLNGKDILVKIVVKDKTLSGGYYFLPDGKESKVSGKLTSDTTGEMTEVDANNQPVATFNGTFKPDGTADITRTVTGSQTPEMFTITPFKDEGAYKPN
ncbi:hypothetical protein C7N43_37050 [Sphingobacteriales bacterium UPWRP_1]|nr:hypothetical protein B6N25_00400 [Sphingobacteriales bacterium TSM_CSS]PSJ71882.1 hypothetical protein C7N43_37050 [Sphingobacteriales bacterium UPWRP_1]